MFVVICYKRSNRAVAKDRQDSRRLQRIACSQQAPEKLCGHARISMVYTSGTMGEQSRRIAAQDTRNRQDERRLRFDVQGCRNFEPRTPPLALARIIHEHFCYNRRSAATTSLRPAGSPLGPSPYCTSTPQVLRAPRAGLATRLSDFATNRHE